MLKGIDNFKSSFKSHELNITINSDELSTQRHLVEIKVEPNHEDLFLSEDSDLTHVIKEEKVDICNSQQLENDESNLNYLQDNNESSSNSDDSSQNDKNVGSYEFVDINKLTEKDSNLTSDSSRHKDHPKTNFENEKKRFKCTECHKSFTWRNDLKRHSRVHTGDKPYKCTTCEKTFTQLASLNAHKLIHTGEKPYECDVCLKTFICKSNLVTHQRIHNNVRPYKCAVCSKGFITSRDLKRHVLTHTGEKPHQCHLCEYKFAHAGALKVHIRSHTGEKPYSCKHCEKSFITTGHLKVHERRIHRIDHSK